MILGFGIPSEPPLRLAIDAAREERLPMLVLNQRQAHLADLAIGTTSGDEGTLVVDGRARPLTSVAGVYVRATDPAVLPECRPRGRRTPDPRIVERSRAVFDLFNEWLETTTVRVVNRPGATGSNMSKPYQSQAARRAGFEIPTTLISNDPSDVRAFVASHGRVIYKSISSIRSIVRQLTPERTADLARLRHLPTQFQAFVEGVNVRVHVVGEQVFATEIATAAVDYRYATRDGLPISMQPIDLPAEVARRCIELSVALDLPFTGIDLMRGPHDRWTCFEVNPSPAYSFYEEQTGQPIARSLVRFLAHGSAS